MPNAKVLSEKQAIVAELTEKIQNATAGVHRRLQGHHRCRGHRSAYRECRENNVDYAVVKNTLLRFAFNNTGPERAGRSAQRHHVSGRVHGGSRRSRPRHAQTTPRSSTASSRSRAASWTASPSLWRPSTSLASIPALPVLQAQVLGTMLAPITGSGCCPEADRREEAALPPRKLLPPRVMRRQSSRPLSL